jgi:uncharacterized protein YneF (UPF0154 family)
MQNTKALFDYSKEVFLAEQDLYAAIERKAGQYFSVFGFLLSASGVTIGLTMNRFVPPHGGLEILLFVLSLLIATGLLVTVFFLFKALRVSVFGIPPLNSEMIKFFEENSEDAVHRALVVKMSDVLKENRAVVRKKSATLKRGYWCIIVTATLLALFGLVFIAEKWSVGRT